MKAPSSAAVAQTVALSPEQARVLAQLGTSMEGRASPVVLLHGATGSGGGAVYPDVTFRCGGTTSTGWCRMRLRFCAEVRFVPNGFSTMTRAPEPAHPAAVRSRVAGAARYRLW